MATIYRYMYDFDINVIRIKEIEMEELKTLFRSDKEHDSVRKSDLDKTTFYSYYIEMYSLNKDIDFFKEQVKKYIEKNIRYWKRDVQKSKKMIRDREKSIKDLINAEVKKLW